MIKKKNSNIDHHHGGEMIEWIVRIPYPLSLILNVSSNFSSDYKNEVTYHVIVNKETGTTEEIIYSIGSFHLLDIYPIFFEFFGSITSVQLDIVNKKWVTANKQTISIRTLEYNGGENWILVWYISNVEIKWIRYKGIDTLYFSEDGIAKKGTIFGLDGIRYLEEISIESQLCIMISIQSTNSECFKIEKNKKECIACVAPFCRVLLADGTTLKRIDELDGSEKLFYSDSKSSSIDYILKKKSSPRDFCNIGRLVITSDHPIHHNGIWTYPGECYSSKNDHYDYVYHLVLSEDYESFVVEGVRCSSLGYRKEILKHSEENRVLLESSYGDRDMWITQLREIQEDVGVKMVIMNSIM